MIIKSAIKVAAITVFSVLIWLLALNVSEPEETIAGHLRFGLVVSVLAIVLVAVMYWIEGRRLEFQIDIKKPLKDFAVGVLWFIVPAALALLVSIGFGLIEIVAIQNPIDIGLTLLLVAGLVMLAEAIPEEIIFRGYIFSKLSKSGRRWMAIFLQAVVFTVFAFLIGALSDPLDASFIFTFGVVLGILRTEYGSVSAPVGFHLACMTLQQSFGSQWGIFEVSSPELLQTYIYGMIPMSVVAGFLITRMLSVENTNQAEEIISRQ